MSFPAFLLRLLRLAVTLAAVVVAIFLVVQLWDVYMRAPWTRDGRVMAQTVVVAPEVSGTIVAVPVHNNEFIHKGDVLFQIDPSRFRIALAQAQASLDAAQLQLRQRQADVARRRGLGGLISKEERQNVDVGASIAQAQLGGAQAAVDLARLNLARSTIHAPVTGYVTHLRLQAGDFAVAGHPLITIINNATFRVIAYFEETKLAGLRRGDAASIKLIGYPQRLTGHVGSIGRGIGDENDTVNRRGLPVINPVFEWVRLAQRIPVDIHIDSVPAGVLLASGMTCSVDVGRQTPARTGLAGRVQRWFEGHL
jgi:multidrug resistance efflux pump